MTKPPTVRLGGMSQFIKEHFPDAARAMFDMFPSSEEITLKELLTRVRDKSGLTLNAWCEDHKFSRSNVSEFLNKGEDSRVAPDTRRRITKEILDDAKRLGMK